MIFTVVQLAAAGVARMFTQATSFYPCDDLILAFGTLHAGGITQGHKSLITWIDSA